MIPGQTFSFGDSIMNRYHTAGIRSAVIGVLVSLFVAAGAFAGEYPALEGVQDVKVVFDVRAAQARSASAQLDLVRRTFKDENIRQAAVQPQFVVVFAGPATKLISSRSEEFPEDQRIYLDKIAATVSDMARDGIRMEVCMFAADMFGVEPTAIPPDIKQVPNGWISLIGYQARGYQLVPIY
jgi:intracellular sulfur oxidation DsrE/DsrF family protein